MKLKEFFDEYGMPIREFARRCGCTPQTIHNILNSSTDIRLSIAMSIEKVTNKQVTVYDLSHGIDQKKLKRKKLKNLDKKAKE
jgi:plasmid maintenance system antidote protein VapI